MRVLQASGRLGRMGLLAGTLAVAALVAAPSVLGGKPVRTSIHYEPGLVFPAGQACSFDVGVQPSRNAFTTLTEFSDGHIQVHTNAKPTFTNLENGTSIVWHSAYALTETYDPATNLGTDAVHGRLWVTFYRGDVVFGEVLEEDVIFLGIEGHLRVTFDLDTFAVTASSLDGRVVADLCSLLA